MIPTELPIVAGPGNLPECHAEAGYYEMGHWFIRIGKLCKHQMAYGKAGALASVR